jgi:hypothetical protein
MMPNTFDVIPKRRRITVFKVGKLWLFKQFFEDKEIFKALLGYYNSHFALKAKRANNFPANDSIV